MLTLGLLLLLTSVSAQCYCRSSNQVETSEHCDFGLGFGPCGIPSSTGVDSCCHPGDTCTAHGFCYFRITIPGTSGYYLGGCTDPTFSDPACPRQCTNLERQDVVYNSSTSLWSCCWNSDTKEPDCSNPTNYTFLAPSPDDLFSVSVKAVSSISSQSSVLSSSSTSAQNSVLTQNSIPTQSSASTQGSAISTLTSAPSSTSSSASPTQTNTETSAGISSGLSTGAKAGIGAGVSVAFIAVLVALWFFLGRRLWSHHHHTGPQSQKQRTTREGSVPLGYKATSNHEQTIMHDLGDFHGHEVPGNSRQNTTHEMSASHT